MRGGSQGRSGGAWPFSFYACCRRKCAAHWAERAKGRCSILNPLPHRFVLVPTEDPVSPYRYQAPDRRKILTAHSKPAIDPA
ncbi:MAG: hypothetical protein E5W63_17210, partial [Mesorhizobium sp.]